MHIIASYPKKPSYKTALLGFVLPQVQLNFVIIVVVFWFHYGIRERSGKVTFFCLFRIILNSDTQAGVNYRTEVAPSVIILYGF